jgi:predicted lipid-binding transport protein (Tim44 family)
MAFAKGDRELLQDLVSGEVYEAFSEMISKREQRCERVELSFVCLENAEITNVGLFNKQVQITIDFLAKLVTVTRAETGQVIAGDPTKISNVSNLWTFARELIPSRKAWKLVETEST